MQLMKLSLFQFRNYKEAEIHFSNGVHILHGKNGAGKTSILESIFYLALTKSFRSSKDRYLIQNSKELFRLQGEFITAAGQNWRCSIAYSPPEGKRLLVDGQRIFRFADYIGEVPIVMLAPSDLQIIQAGPLLRRRFVDILLSQSSKIYLHHLMQYKRSLKQRNQLLQSEKVSLQALEPWEENLVANGTEIIQRREAAVAALSAMAQNFYRELSRMDDSVELIYHSDVLQSQSKEITENYHRLFHQKRQREIFQRSTLIGPHRDDVLFLLNGKSMRSYASQGEQKTMVVALKLAEFHYLQQQSRKAPILLFDDIFGELDAGRIEHLLKQLGNIGQVFVSTTSRNFFDKLPALDFPTRYYRVWNGQVELQESVCGAGKIN